MFVSVFEMFVSVFQMFVSVFEMFFSVYKMFVSVFKMFVSVFKFERLLKSPVRVQFWIQVKKIVSRLHGSGCIRNRGNPLIQMG